MKAGVKGEDHSAPRASTSGDWHELSRVLMRFLASQRGRVAVLTLKRLQRAGFKHPRNLSGFYAVLRELFLLNGLPDPLGRGTWRLVREEHDPVRFVLFLAGDESEG
ncbi:MAG: hypothetical protein ACP5KA_07180 [Desulfurococcaceae archaeon]